jgi:hypothetical protein
MWGRGVKVVMAVAAVTATVLVVGAGPAGATSGFYYEYAGAYRGYGEFQSYGDHWYACDIATDGWGVRVSWSVPATGRTGSVSDTGGNDGNCAHQNVNIGEGNAVYYRVCLLNNGSVIACSGALPDRA